MALVDAGADSRCPSRCGGRRCRRRFGAAAAADSRDPAEGERRSPTAGACDPAMSLVEPGTSRSVFESGAAVRDPGWKRASWKRPRATLRGPGPSCDPARSLLRAGALARSL